jgi:hypothetical protein
VSTRVCVCACVIVIVSVFVFFLLYCLFSERNVDPKVHSSTNQVLSGQVLLLFSNVLSPWTGNNAHGVKDNESLIFHYQTAAAHSSANRYCQQGRTDDKILYIVLQVFLLRFSGVLHTRRRELAMTAKNRSVLHVHVTFIYYFLP